jgi:hypothetical protein
VKKSLLAVALALFVSGLAGAAPPNEFRITAPQPFTVGGTAMPAGVYDIGLMSPAGVLEISSVTAHVKVMLIGLPISSGPGFPLAKVTFTPVNGRLALTQIYLPNGAGFGVATHAAIR